MGEHYNADRTQLVSVSCDESGCWAEIPVAGNFTMGPTPQVEGWTTNGEKGDARRYFCGEHGD